MIQVHEVNANHALQAPLSFQDIDRQVVSELLASSRKAVEQKLHQYLCGVLKQFGELDIVSLEIAKALMSYSWRKKQDEFLKSFTSALEVIISSDNPRWTSFRRGLTRFPSMSNEQEQNYRRKFIGMEAMLAESDLIDEMFKYEYKAGLRMYHATRKMLRHEPYNNPLLHPPTHVQSVQAVKEYYQVKYEELAAEQTVLDGCRESIQTLTGVNLPLWNQAFENRIAQVQNDIQEVNEALSGLKEG